jgi:hypothetical protein
METVLRHCSSCGEERDFESPPCPDGHGCDCPELVCVSCGQALMIDALVIAAPRVATFVHHAA